MKMTTGGGEGADDCGVDDMSPGEGSATVWKGTLFPQVPWTIGTSDVTTIIEMKNRTRLTDFSKELLSLPRIMPGACIAGAEDEIRGQRQHDLARRSSYGDLLRAEVSLHLHLLDA